MPPALNCHSESLIRLLRIGHPNNQENAVKKNLVIAVLCLMVLMLTGVVIAQKAQGVENIQKAENHLTEAARLLRGYQPSSTAQTHRDTAVRDIQDAINHLNSAIREDVGQ
jgi:hypothetical protein